jgi:O-antigen/teichoic acid export membrane protein
LSERVTLKKGAQEFLWVAAPKFLGGGLLLLFNLILLRRFGPEQYGMVTVCLSGILLFDAILGAAVDMGILRLAPLYQRDQRLESSLQIQQAGLILKPVAMLAPALLVVGFAGPLSALLFQRKGGEPLLYLSLVSLLGLLVFRSAQTHFQVSREFLRYGGADLLHSLLRFGGITTLLFIGSPSPIGILSCYALAPIVATAFTLPALGKRLLQVPFSWPKLKELAQVVNWYLATAITGVLLSRMDVFLVSSLASVGEAGIFSAAQAITIAPQLLGTYLAVVCSPRVMPMWKDGSLFPIYRRFQIGVGIVCGAIYLLAFVGLEKFSALLLPRSFQRASGVILLLLPSALFALINFPWTVSFLLFLRPRFLFLFDVISLPILLLIYAVAVPRYGAAGAAVISALFALAKTSVMQTVAWRILRAEAGDKTGEKGSLSTQEPGLIERLS